MQCVCIELLVLIVLEDYVLIVDLPGRRDLGPEVLARVAVVANPEHGDNTQTTTAKQRRASECAHRREAVTQRDTYLLVVDRMVELVRIGAFGITVSDALGSSTTS